MPFALDAVFTALGVDPLAQGVQIVNAAHITPPQAFSPTLPFVSTRPLLICGLAAQAQIESVQAALLTIYPGDHPLRLVAGATVTDGAIGVLAQVAPQQALCAYIPALPILDAVRTFDALREITARLRAPDGCPWDRQQTHESLKPFVLEETYEVLEALDSGNRAELCEELGDLMMQVMFHSQVAVENGEFTLNDVLAGISSKLLRRHPHVFGDVQVSGAQDVLRNWQSIKQAEKKNDGNEAPPSLLGSVPVQLPALAYAQAMQERAARVGFLRQGAAALQRAADTLDRLGAGKASAEALEEYGDVLFSLVLVARWLGIEAEEALRLANRRYRQRFMAVEALCRQRGLDVQTLDEQEREHLWQETSSDPEPAA
jgi:tetrapyrrole methylase family protein/MazG family protein